jgi:type IV pilus assembly protein PilB
LDEPIEAFEALGCARCHQGFQGRLGLYQTMPMTDNLGAIVLEHGAELSLRQTALTEGMRSLRALGLLWVQRGHTTMGEVLLNTPE